MSTHLIISDPHASPKHNNNRALWLGHLINDLKPDVVINIGDSAEMASLASYDRGTKLFQGRTYRADIDSHLDFQEKLWSVVKKQKKALPRRIVLEGNHDHRIWKAVNIQPELEGTISFKDLNLEHWYDDIVPYTGGSPGIKSVDGVTYAHFFVSGIKGQPVGGTHPAASLIAKKLSSATCGHSHLADWSAQTNLRGQRIMGCFVGCLQDWDPDWAGEVASLWWRGVVFKRNVSDGGYDPQFISLDAIKKEYGHLT